jgi:hypothetical protein
MSFVRRSFLFEAYFQTLNFFLAGLPRAFYFLTRKWLWFNEKVIKIKMG